MFACKVCLQHEKHLASLQDQIKFLKTMLAPIPHLHPSVVEADALLSARHDQVELPDAAEEEALLAELSERDRILSGNF
jgi:hypothetical protein